MRRKTTNFYMICIPTLWKSSGERDGLISRWTYTTTLILVGSHERPNMVKWCGTTYIVSGRVRMIVKELQSVLPMLVEYACLTTSYNVCGRKSVPSTM